MKFKINTKTKQKIIHIALFVIILSFIVYIVHRLFKIVRVEGFSGNVINTNNYTINNIDKIKLYNLANIRKGLTSNQDNSLVSTNFDPSMISVELSLDIPGLYLRNTPDCTGCHLDKAALPIRAKILTNINKIRDLFSSYLDGLIYCSDSQVNNYINNLKKLITYLASKKFYNKTISDMREGQMYLNFTYLPAFLQGYLLIYDNFQKTEKSMISAYIKQMYLLIKNNMMSQRNNWKYGYGRLSLLCGYIFNDKTIYKNGLDILNYAFTQIDKNGLILSEMNRGSRALIYNCKSANFICDSLYFMINTSNIKFNNNITNGVTSFANLIVSTVMKKSATVKRELTVIETNIYETTTKLQQEAPTKEGVLNFIHYSFVLSALNKTNKQYIDSIFDSTTLIDDSPLAIGL